jgi:hypothetical protein
MLFSKNSENPLLGFFGQAFGLSFKPASALGANLVRRHCDIRLL